MDYMACINAAIGFIEDNLFKDITPLTVANHIGFSEYHFHRIFQAMLGESVAAYIRKRRMNEAAKLLKTSNTPILELAMLLGFESHEAFTRTFKKLYGVNPTQYRKLKNVPSSHIRSRTTETMIRHLQTELTLNPRFEIKGPELVVGLAGSYAEGSPESFSSIAKLWKLFLTRKHEIAHVKEGFALGVCLAEHASVIKAPDHTFVYIAGLPVTKVDDVPIGMLSCSIPQGKYAVFTHTGALDKLPETVNYIWGTWIPKNVEHYRHSNRPDFELYDGRFDPRSSLGGFDIYVPVEHG